MEIPQTIEEAKRLGYELKKITLDEAKAIRDTSAGANIQFNSNARDCSTIPEGHLCWEGDCDAFGQKEVLYCDGTQGCTVYSKVRCR